MVMYFFDEEKADKRFEDVSEVENGSETENEALSEENKACLFISNDRSSVSVRLSGSECYADYKRAAANRDFINACDQAELIPATVTSDGYVCSVRGRVTLKEIVCGEEPLTIRSVWALSNCFKKLLSCAGEYGIDARDFVFDYNAVPVRKIESEYKFIYMPGLRRGRDRTTAGDLIRILFLNVDTENIDATQYEILKESVRKIRCEENLEGFIEDIDDLMKKIEELSEEESIKDKIFNFLKTKTAKNDERPEQFVCCLKGEGLIEDLEMERHVDRRKSISLKIGRDGEWADICVPDLFASRKHAELTVSGSGMVTVENYSMNGISVDGENSGTFFERDLNGTQVRIRITDNCGLVLSCA